jgi:endo-1,4-beta-D-glucanase Y
MDCSVRFGAVLCALVVTVGCASGGSGASTSSGNGASSGSASSSGTLPSSGANAGSPASSGGSTSGGSGASFSGSSGSSANTSSGNSDGGSSGSATAVCGTPQPFGSHIFHYPSDVLFPSGGQAALDQKARQAYDQWKAKYVKQGCGGYYVLSGGGTGAGVGDEVSEGHGYGMVITAMMAGYDPNAETIFDGMVSFFKKFPTASHQNLMSWTVHVAGGCQVPPNQMDSATDGDLDIAYALLLADHQWPGKGYLAEAKAVILAALGGDVNPTTHLTTLGDWATPSAAAFYATRPSDFMLDHFRAFGLATADPAHWQAGTVEAMYSLISTMDSKFSPQTGLLPDFVVNTNTAPQPAAPNFLETAADGEYFYNSCRTPWRIATDYIVSGDMRAKNAVALMNGWIIAKTGGNPAQIKGGYTLAGADSANQKGPTQAFSSPFAVAAMLSGNQAWLDALWSSRSITEGYYPDSITMLCLLVLSGNWWPPC